MHDETPLHAATNVLTSGFDPALSVGSARPPVFRSSTYVFPSPEAAEHAFNVMGGRAQLAPGESPALVYSRFNHPNAEILEAQLIPLEPLAQAALVFNSGMSAIMAALMPYLKPGSALVYTVPIYGGTQKLIQNFLEPWGVIGVPVDGGNADQIARTIAATKQLGAVLLETPANPTLKMTDIASAAKAAHAHPDRPPVMVDNTMMGPEFQHPLELGADIVLYSATKYLSGFSDLIGGVALSANPALLSKVRSLRGLFGTILQPDECWILQSRLPTVGMRMRHAAENTIHIVKALVGHPAISRIHFPTLFEEPEQQRLYQAQCSSPGAMFSIELVDGKVAAFNFLRSIKLGRNAVSLGGMETLVCHPQSTTHSGFTPADFERSGVTEGLVRFSIGLEDWRDLLADFQQALAKC